MFIVSASHSLALPVSANKVMKVSALKPVVSATEQRRLPKQMPVTERVSSGEYLAADQQHRVVPKAAHIVNADLNESARNLDFYSQHKSLTSSSPSVLGLNIDCLL